MNKHILNNGGSHDGEECTYTLCWSKDPNIKDKCLRWCTEIEQKLNIHGVMQAEGSNSVSVAAVGNSADGKGVSDGLPHDCIKCENCGCVYKPTDLYNYKCPMCGN